MFIEPYIFNEKLYKKIEKKLKIVLILIAKRNVFKKNYSKIINIT